MEPGDRELIQTALAGDPAAFESLMKAYAMRVYSVAYAILQDRQDAEDCTQEAFFKAWRNRRQVRASDKFPAWLFAIARHAGQDRLRRRAARPRTVPFSTALDGELEPIAGVLDQSAARADDAEQHRRVHALLSTLPERHRTALTLRYLEGLDHRGIEQAMDLSHGALRGVLSRALETMRRGLRRAATPSSLHDAL